MRNISTILIIIFIVYTYYEAGVYNSPKNQAQIHKQQALEANAPSRDDQKQTVNIQNSEINASEKISEKSKSQDMTNQENEGHVDSDYVHKPEGFMERVITNAVTKYIASPKGEEIAKSLLTPKDMVFNNSFSVSTQGFNNDLRKYLITESFISSDPISVCGQKVKLQYIIHSLQDENSDPKTEECILGNCSFRELNIFAIGHNLNSSTAGLYLSNYDQTKQKSNILPDRIRVSVIEHITKHNFDASKIRIFDSYITTSYITSCKDKIKFDYLIKKVNGDVIKNGEITYVVGDNKMPMIFSHLVYNMPFVGVRTILLPYNYLSEGSNNLLTGKSNEFVILELSEQKLLEKASE